MSDLQQLLEALAGEGEPRGAAEVFAGATRQAPSACAGPGGSDMGARHSARLPRSSSWSCSLRKCRRRITRT